MELHCLSYNYSKSSSEDKKCLVFGESNSLARFYKDLVAALGISDILVLNTCNRCEVYYFSVDSHVETIKDVLFANNFESKNKIFALHLEGHAAIKHLFEVSVGVKSQVLGDNQVIFQLKEAYKIANENTQLSGLFHQLMHLVFRLNKRIVNETRFKEGSVSIASSAVQLLGNLVKKHKQTPILLIGTGQNGRDTLKNLMNSSYSNIYLSNRTNETAEKLAQEMSLGFIPFEKLSENLDKFKVVILSVHHSEYLIDTNFFDWRKIRYDFTYFLDLGVLPSIDPEIEKNPCFEIYDLSYMTDRNEEGLENRNLALQSVAKIIEEECKEFEKNFAIKSVLDQFYNLDAQNLVSLQSCEFLDEFLNKSIGLDLSETDKDYIKGRVKFILEKSLS